MPKNSKTNPITVTVHAHDQTNDHDVYFDTVSHHSELPHNGDNHDLLDSFSCETAAENRTLYDSFNINGCSHFYCINCIVKYVVSKLDDNVTCISCPVSGCNGVLDPEYCRQILPENLFDRWGAALCNCLVDSSEKFYCPYKDCSGLLIKDAGDRVQKAVCLICRREICVQCSVPWHSEFDCGRFQKLKKKGEDSMVKDLASRKKWRNCPNCKIFIEKTVGCYYIKCRCGCAFCYNCGTRSTSTSHTCRKCKR